MKGITGGIAIVAVSFAIGAGQASAVGASKVIEATEGGGIQSIGALEISREFPPTNLADVVGGLGQPTSVRRPYPEVCRASFGRSLQLDFVSFGGESRCSQRFLQNGVVRRPDWEVRVDSRSYKVRMPKRAIPQGVRFDKGVGYRLASVVFLGNRIGSVNARVGARKRIGAISLFFGLAGD